jgi:methanogen homocitrate synthase
LLEKYDILNLKSQKNYSPEGIWASPLNYTAKNHQPLNKDIYIHDVTLRDGEQAAGVVFSMEDRLNIGRALSELGVKRIEAGLPTVSELIFESMSRLVKMKLDAEIVSFARAHNDEMRCAIHRN